METPRVDDQTQGSKPPSPQPAAQRMGLIAMGLGRFRVKSEHEYRLDWEREYRSHP